MSAEIAAIHVRYANLIARARAQGREALKAHLRLRRDRHLKHQKEIDLFHLGYAQMCAWRAVREDDEFQRYALDVERGD